MEDERIDIVGQRIGKGREEEGVRGGGSGKEGKWMGKG